MNASAWDFLHKWIAMSDEHEVHMNYANGNLHVRFMDLAGGAMVGYNLALNQHDLRVEGAMLKAFMHAVANMEHFKREQRSVG